jgi:3-isopropylmalate/(R)-2-methylmalate dehydratase small subunit
MACFITRGRAWKFGDNISTDSMMPSFTRGTTAKERASFCMRANRPEFSAAVSPGDVIVGGKNFGCGSSRPVAVNLITLGVSCVVAESFGRIFFRSAIGHGLPVLVCNGIHAMVDEGDLLSINVNNGEITNLTKGTTACAEPLPEIAVNVLSAGGIVPLLKKEYGTLE